MWSLEMTLGLEVSIKDLEGDRFLCGTINPWSVRGEGRLGVARSQTSRMAEGTMITTAGLNAVENCMD